MSPHLNRDCGHAPAPLAAAPVDEKESALQHITRTMEAYGLEVERVGHFTVSGSNGDARPVMAFVGFGLVMLWVPGVTADNVKLSDPGAVEKVERLVVDLAAQAARKEAV